MAKPNQELKKKKAIAWLLGAASLVAAVLLAYSPQTDDKILSDLAQADSLIYQELAEFAVPLENIKRRSVLIDSVFERVTYLVPVPGGFSKTFLHFELAQRLRPFEIDVPARVHFPEMDMNIHLYFKDTIIRTLVLRTDTSLTAESFPASIVFFFDKTPSPTQLETIAGLGEPVTVALQTPDPSDADSWLRVAGESAPDLDYAFWIDEAARTGEAERDREIFAEKVKQFGKVKRRAQFVSLLPGSITNTESVKKALVEQRSSLLATDSRQVLDSESGKFAFNQGLDQFMQQARNASGPTVIIRVSGESLTWLRESLPRFRKGGMIIVPPSKRQ